MLSRCRKLGRVPGSVASLRLSFRFATSTPPNPPPSDNPFDTKPKSGILIRFKDWKLRFFRLPSVTKEDIVTDKTIRRELLNDILQLPLKVVACFVLPVAARGPFMAQLMRSMIDFLNHLSIWFVNSVNFGPSSNYPYGLEKIKNILSHTVAMLFASSGIYNLHESYVLFLAGNEILTHEGSLTTTILYLLGIAIECSVIYLNIQATQEMREKKTSIFSNWADGIQDPLLKVILTENILTLTSMAIPLTCQAVSSLIWPSTIVTASGVLLMGVIQLYLSVHLYIHNMLVLAGDKSIEKVKIDRISQIIKRSPFVVNLNTIIGVWVDSEHFRLTLDITVDHNALIDETSELFEDMIEEASNIEDVLKRKEYTLEIANQAHINALSEVRQGEDKIRKEIQQEFPECTNIQVSFRLEEVPLSPYPIFQNLEEDIYRGISRDSQLASFMDSVLPKSKKPQTKVQPLDRAECMSNEISKEAIDRMVYLQEDIRFKMLNDSLREFISKTKFR